MEKIEINKMISIFSIQDCDLFTTLNSWKSSRKSNLKRRYVLTTNFLIFYCNFLTGCTWGFSWWFWCWIATQSPSREVLRAKRKRAYRTDSQEWWPFLSELEWPSAKLQAGYSKNSLWIYCDSYKLIVTVFKLTYNSWSKSTVKCLEIEGVTNRLLWHFAIPQQCRNIRFLLLHLSSTLSDHPNSLIAGLPRPPLQPLRDERRSGRGGACAEDVGRPRGRRDRLHHVQQLGSGISVTCKHHLLLLSTPQSSKSTKSQNLPLCSNTNLSSTLTV